MIGIIYCFTFPNNKKYIGKTQKDLQIRLRSHKHSSKYKKSYLYNAIRLYGWENIKIEILCNCDTLEQLNLKEIEYISSFNTQNIEYGYNLRSGGEGGEHNENTKQKISESNKGIKNGMYNKIPWNKNKKLTEQHIENLRISHLGQEAWNKGKQLPKREKRTDEVKNKISKANSGENNGMSKLTCEIVKEIRQKYQTGNYTQKKLAELYGLTSERINRIVSYKAWSKCE